MKSSIIKVLSLAALAGLFLTSCGGEKPSTSSSEEEKISSSEVVSSSEEQKDPTVLATLAEAVEIAVAAGEAGTSVQYTVTGTIKTITKDQFGEMVLMDTTGELKIYGIQGWSSLVAGENKPAKGDIITLKGTLKTYKGEAEMNNDATIVDYTHVEVGDDGTYAPSTISAARTAEVGAKVQVEGVVASFGNDGFWLIDNSGSIFVYDAAATGVVAVGNKIKVNATKTRYISSRETSAAEALGYTGANQLTDLVILENDKGNNEIPTSWMESKTIKELMNVPATENISGNVYKTEAFIKFSQGASFVNYYINDYDGHTGSYVYTTHDGSDLDWLAPYDGKLVSMYLGVVNAKSEASGHTWRFYPVKIVNDNVTFDLAKAPEYAIEYHVADQIAPKYTADPARVLPASVSNAALGVTDVAMTYVSDNTEVIDFEDGTEDDAPVKVMHMKGTGLANVTVTATLGEHTSSRTFRIECGEGVSHGMTVLEALNSELYDAEKNNIIRVSGVISAGFTNWKDGFYLTDETGTIPVRMTSADALADLHIGDEVTLEGERTVYNNNKGETLYGIDQLYHATLVENRYGNHAMPMGAVVTDKTYASIIAGYDVLAGDRNVYYTQGYLWTYGSGNSTQLAMSVDSTKKDEETYKAYAGSVKQYSWILDEFNEKMVYVCFYLANPNAKTYGRFMPLWATDGTKTLVNPGFLAA